MIEARLVTMAVLDAMELTGNRERQVSVMFNVIPGKLLSIFKGVITDFSSSNNDAAEITDLKEQVERLTKVVDQLTVRSYFLFMTSL